MQLGWNATAAFSLRGLPTTVANMGLEKAEPLQSRTPFYILTEECDCTTTVNNSHLTLPPPFSVGCE